MQAEVCCSNFFRPLRDSGTDSVHKTHTTQICTYTSVIWHSSKKLTHSTYLHLTWRLSHIHMLLLIIWIKATFCVNTDETVEDLRPSVMQIWVYIGAWLSFKIAYILVYYFYKDKIQIKVWNVVSVLILLLGKSPIVPFKVS